ncbi:hypothetical protein TIFTF001_040915 [Ficus carica]|uniref:Uncharacterized protein n=1 Tax=Ficus carica TaxID=3494 RepID=A0AA87YZZ9_FICCA|nr:hypothetical protein TIFTF001_040915 [Ficus carica]
MRPSFWTIEVSAIGTSNITNGQQEGYYSVSTLQKVLFFSALPLIIFGSSIHRTNALERLVDEEDSALTRTSNFVSKVAVIVVAAVAFVIPFTLKQWQYRFLFPAAFMVLATAIFLSGSSMYKKDGPQGSPQTTVLRVLVASFLRRSNNSLTNSSSHRHNHRTPYSHRFRYLDRAVGTDILKNQSAKLNQNNRWRNCTEKEVEEIKKVLVRIPLCLTLFILGVIYCVRDSYFIEQAGTMDQYVGRSKVPLVVLEFGSKISKALFASLYSVITKKFTRNEKSKYAGCVGIAVSMVLATLCCMVSAKMEILRLFDVNIYNLHDTDSTVPMSMFWLLPQNCLLGGFKGILDKSIDFFFSDDDDPTSSEWFMIHFAFFIFGLGNIGSVVLVSMLSQLSTWGSDGTSWFEDNLNDSRLDNYYWVLASLSIGNILCYRILYSCTDLRSEVRYQSD